LAAAAGSPAGGAARHAGWDQGPQAARQRQGPQEATGQRPLPTLDGVSGEAITQCKPRHRHQESRGFLRQIETFVFGVLDIQLSDDHPCTDKHVKVRDWLVPLPRFHLHHTLPYASWLNQLERWYRFALLRLRDQHAVGDLAGQRLQRRCSDDVKELIAKIEQFVAAYNRTKEPFNRITTVDSILKKLTQS